MFRLPAVIRRKHRSSHSALSSKPYGRGKPTTKSSPGLKRRRFGLIRRAPRRSPKQAGFGSGAGSTMRLFLAPLGKKAARFHQTLGDEGRLEQGLVVLLPGIDGCTTVVDNIARGLHASGIGAAIEVHDWRRFRGWSPFHLATARNNDAQAQVICGRILEYRDQYPDRPIHIVGHSAGAGMALFILQHLPPGIQVDSVVLLAAAVSRSFNVHALQSHTSNGIWNFWSRADLPTVGLGTMIFGTMDRRHTASAGALGFRKTAQTSVMTEDGGLLHEVGYSLAMARCWNFGGHFGCTNVAFVSQYVSPIVAGRVASVTELRIMARRKKKQKTSSAVPDIR